MRAKMRGVWATAQLTVAIATFAWATMLWLGTGEPFWPVCTLVAGVFFLVAAILFAAGHPDAGVVGFFGLLFFTVASALLPVANYGSMDRDLLIAVLGALGVIGIAQILVLFGASRRDPPADADAWQHAS